ncbi:hypothetical protein BV25DRAFT_1910874 [Artomyces pyxidatus]|uniref:Uncharacterized protein n=1 Tax=Artomyces pyxidatus TaxID=48021 RepID=A0ACB8TL65_9AGAM|nr:hypothetical protein BV25DRAFT_1910874 [Artomyces pyxidatus]
MSSETSGTVTDPAQNPSVDDIIDDIRTSSLYLGSENLLAHVEWSKHGRYGHKLILKITDDSVGDNEKTEAEIRWIGRISTEGFWLYVSGGFGLGKQPPFPTPFTKAKATARLICPSNPRFGSDSDWEDMTLGAKALMESVPGFKDKINNSILDTPNARKIKVRHSVFEEVTKDVYVEQQNASELLLMSNWKCRSNEAQSALEEIIESNDEILRSDIPDAAMHFGQVIPVFKASGDLVFPNNFEKALRGATVEICAAISHEVIQGSDNFYADIRYITILDDPPPPPSSPSRKRGFEPPAHLSGKRRRI